MSHGLGSWTRDWVDCQRCRLSKHRGRVVFGRGTVPADVLLVGEAPGPVEDETGEPFTGPAGKLLDRGLKVIERLDATWYLANLVGCYPPGMRAPETREVETCEDRLLAIVREVNPAAVVLLGAEPTFHILTAKLTPNRGRVMSWALPWGDLPAIPTWHPSGILRSGESERMIELRTDLENAARIARDIIPF
jgi:DNA polymerase